jgi:hypothetical protein
VNALDVDCAANTMSERPLTPDEIALVQALQAAAAAPVLPSVGDVVDNAGSPGIVTAVDPATGMVSVAPLAPATTVAASSVTPAI